MVVVWKWTLSDNEDVPKVLTQEYEFTSVSDHHDENIRNSNNQDDENLPEAQAQCDDYYASTDEYDIGDPEAQECDDYYASTDEYDIGDPEAQGCGDKYVLSVEESDTGSKIDNNMTHTVSFKCIGVTRDKGIQKLLEYIAENLSVEETPVRLNPEPNNPYDNNAIAFEAHMKKCVIILCLLHTLTLLLTPLP